MGIQQSSSREEKSIHGTEGEELEHLFAFHRGASASWKLLPA